MTDDPEGLPPAVFRTAGPDRFAPTPLARGPWSPDHQHGGAPAALLARAVARAEPLDAPHVARLSIDLIRPVPLTPIDVRVRVARPGRKVQVIEAVLEADGVEVAWCRALRLRVADVDIPSTDIGLPPSLPPPDACPELALMRDGPLGFWRAIEPRIAHGDWLAPGPACVWFRLRVPIIEGEDPLALQRVAAAADFGNGVSAAVARDRFSFINPDVHVALHRLPAGEWIALDGRSFAEPTGVGVAECALFDEVGRIGRSTQSLLLQRIGPRT